MKRFTFAEGVPLTQDDRGSIRVTGSRVTLDTIVGRYHVGDNVADIHDGFPTVSIAQINAILDWYHQHQVAADEYLEELEAENQKILERIMSTPEHLAHWEKIRSRQARLTKT